MPRWRFLGAWQHFDGPYWTRCKAGAVSRLVSASPAILPVRAPCGCMPRLPPGPN